MAVFFRGDPDALRGRDALPPLILPVVPDAAPASPGLPEGVWRDSFVKHVIAAYREDLSPVARSVLAHYAGMTSPEDWTRPGDGPVCWVRQVDAARDMGHSDRAVRDAEADLAALGLIKKRCAANGGRRAPRGEAAPALGIHFAPMIRRHGEVSATLRQRRKDAEDLDTLHRRVSAMRFRVKRLARAAGACPDAAGALAWLAGLPRGLSRSTDAEELAGIARCLEGYCDLLDAGEEDGGPDAPAQDPRHAAPADPGAPQPGEAARNCTAPMTGPHRCPGRPESLRDDRSGAAHEEAGAAGPASDAGAEAPPDLWKTPSCAAICSGRAEQMIRSHIYTTKRTLCVETAPWRWGSAPTGEDGLRKSRRRAGGRNPGPGNRRPEPGADPRGGWCDHCGWCDQRGAPPRPARVVRPVRPARRPQRPRPPPKGPF